MALKFIDKKKNLIHLVYGLNGYKFSLSLFLFWVNFIVFSRVETASYDRIDTTESSSNSRYSYIFMLQKTIINEGI